MKIITKASALIMSLIVLLSLTGAVSYSLAASLAATSSLTATAKTSEVTLKWKKVSKADGYRIYMWTGKSWKALKTQSKLTYTVDSLKASTTYKFAVKAYDKEKGKTTWGKLKTVSVKTKKLSTSPTLTATPGKNQVSLKWSAVPGASGYRIYQYKNGKWQKLKDVTSRSYTVKSLKINTVYKFRVRAFVKGDEGISFGSYSKTVSAKTYDTTKTVITSASAKTNSVTLKWNKVSGATGYRVYRLENGSWKKLATVSKLQYTATKLQGNTTYTFCVKAYKKTDGKVTWYTKSDNKIITTLATAEQLKPYRIEKYKSTFNSDSLYVKMETNMGSNETIPVEFATKGGSVHMKMSMDGMEARMLYLASKDKAYMIMDSLFMYAVVPKQELDEMGINDIIAGFRIENVGDITAKNTTYSGKNVVCESYTDTLTGEKVNYYFEADKVIACERTDLKGNKVVMIFHEISVEVSSSYFKAPPKIYIDISDWM